MVYSEPEYTEREDRRNYPEAYEGIPPAKSTMKKLLKLLNDKHIISEAERIALEA